VHSTQSTRKESTLSIQPSNKFLYDSLTAFIRYSYVQADVTRLMLKFWNVTAVPFLDFYQFFVGRSYKIISRRREKAKSHRPAM
jgi:hypothetical protein